MDRKLNRNTANAVFGGVCSGIAGYLGVDVTLTRIIWVVLTVFTWGFLMGAVYLTLWAVLPAADGTAKGIRFGEGNPKGVIWLAAALIALGAFLLLRELLPFDVTPYLFGAGLIAAGSVLIWATTRRK